MYRLDEIAQRFGLELRGDPSLAVRGLCGLSDDLADHLSFVAALVTRSLPSAPGSPPS